MVEYIKRKRKYDRYFKLQAAKLSFESGKTVKEVLKDSGICSGNLIR